MHGLYVPKDLFSIFTFHKYFSAITGKCDYKKTQKFNPDSYQPMFSFFIDISHNLTH